MNRVGARKVGDESVGRGNETDRYGRGGRCVGRQVCRREEKCDEWEEGGGVEGRSLHSEAQRLGAAEPPRLVSLVASGLQELRLGEADV